MLILKRIFFVLSIALGLFFISCTKKPTKLTCKNDDDCMILQDSKQKQGYCVMGMCEECRSDSDCKDPKKCMNNQCKAMCKADNDCDENSYCQNKTCVAKCDSDESCPDEQICSLGKCENNQSVSSKNNDDVDCSSLAKVLFDFDSSNIKDEYKENITQVAKCLKNNPSSKLTIFGHTDERGTKEYNLALGERRALAVKNYLTKEHSLAAAQIQIVSYGSEKPAQEGKDESAYAQNRRSEFSLR